MPLIDTVIIGAGQAGLAASRLLTEARREHVVLERDRVGERWQSTTWDSLRLLTPNWMTRLPHWQYAGNQTDGYMRAVEVAQFLDAYRQDFGAPVVEGTAVRAVTAHGSGFDVQTSTSDWRATNVVVATGWCDQPSIPAVAAQLHSSIEQLSPSSYRHPDQLVDGGVLIVGASATGAQLADELSRAGRKVFLAVGKHTRMPRRYRGHDIYWWLDRLGMLDRTIDDMPSRAAARHEPSLQLVGSADRKIDLPSLAASGVTLTGRLVGLDGTIAAFDDDLNTKLLDADRRLRRLLSRIDGHLGTPGSESPAPFSPIDAPRCIDLKRAGVTTVIWATGHRRVYPWLEIPVLDDEGEISHQYGVTPVPGLYVLGQRFQRTRRSNFLDGVGADAAVVTQHLLARRSRPGGLGTPTEVQDRAWVSPLPEGTSSAAA